MIDSFDFYVEDLEPRVLLSTVTVFAAGTTGNENLRLRIDGNAVASWTVAAGAEAGQFQSYVFDDDSISISPDQIRIEFTNDVYLPDQGIDRNLRVDAIDIDGVRYETEFPSVFSTGTWKPEDGIQPGFRESEYLHGNGYFQFADSSNELVIRARGDEGGEQFNVLIDEVVFDSFAVSQDFQNYEVQLNGSVQPEQVRIEFINDVWLPAQGIDSNLQIDFIQIDGTVYQAEGSTVYSTGTWLPTDGIQAGYRQSEFLHANGYLQFAQPNIPTNGSGFELETIAEGLIQPVAFAVAADGRIFVAEKEGRVKVVHDGSIDTFLDINEEVNSGHDRGLIGIALDPDFLINGHVYLNFTEELDPENPDSTELESVAGGRLIRISATESNPNVADLSTRVDVLTGHQMSHFTHTVGDIDFDNQGNLIFTWGDGGFDIDLVLQATDPNSRQGKLFRINRETFEGVPGNPYFDSDNPNSVASKVWAIGIRNSWKLTVDRPTGDVYLGEVTDSGPEEINVLRADGSTVLNFGWPYYEDDNRTGYNPLPDNFVYERAFIALPHTDAGGGDAIVGGAVFRGTAYPGDYQDRYFFGNFNQGILYTADEFGNYEQFGATGAYGGTVDIQLGPDGHMWFMSLFTGRIERLVFTGNATTSTPPSAVLAVDTTAGSGPLSVLFDAQNSFDTDGDDLAYEWDLNGDGDFEVQGPSSITNTYTVPGRTTVSVRVIDDEGNSDTASVEINVLAETYNENLALGKPTLQSPTQDDQVASRAVDGDFGEADNPELAYSQTQVTRTPLWEVDLGSSHFIYDVLINIPPEFELSDFWILVSDNPFSSGNLDAARQDPGVWSYHDNGSAGSFDVVSVNAIGRYIRIQRAGIETQLTLGEVRVSGFEASQV